MRKNYPSDGMLADDDGIPLGTMGWIAEELTGEDLSDVLGTPVKYRQNPPADWGPRKRELQRQQKR